MPAQEFIRFDEHTRAVVWAATETAEALLAALPPAWRTPLPPHPARALETLSARRALLALDDSLAADSLEKDAYGKPFVARPSTAAFSLSHSHGHAAALTSATACGIDLQLRVEKIVRLRRRFERPDERAFVERQPSEVDALHVLWGAKEALYKLWGRRRLDWREHLSVEPFELLPGGGTFRGRIAFGGEVLHARCYWRWVGELCLVAAVHEA